VFEHADVDQPRVEEGYCTDDMARVLVATVREPRPRPAVVDRLEALALQFVCDAQTATGEVRNRRSASGTWEMKASNEDCWGRALWGLGSAARLCDDPGDRAAALAAFHRGARLRAPWPRTMAFAGLGAAEVLAADPGDELARSLLTDAADAVDHRENGAGWAWPERRLSYANAVVPDVLMAAGSLLPSDRLLRRGLGLLRWLLDHETVEGTLSVTPVGGAGPEDPSGRFDQQPIEVAALADACGRAFAITGDVRWSHALQQTARWFNGINDVGCRMWDDQSGGGYDGLHARGPNRNQGAESTLALISTMQRCDALAPVLT
jgi:hypothetical protein